jgi:outer membrane protein assembly factor BamB
MTEKMIANFKNDLSSGWLTSFIVLLIIICCSSTAQAGERLWHKKTLAGYVDSSPGIGDLDRDGINDLVLCTTAGRILAVDSGGFEMWTFDTNAQIANPSVVIDLNGDQKLEVLAITNTGKIVCLDGESGGQLWDFNLPAGVEWGMTSLAAANLQSDSNLEIIAADNQGNLTCLTHSGEQLWSKKIKGPFNSAPAIADLNGDGENEILVGSTTSPLICFSNKGRELWRVKDHESSGSSPLVYDLDSDNQLDILLGCGKNLTLFDNKGGIVWQYAMKRPVHDGISVGDIDGDGDKEIIAVDLLGSVVCLDVKGTLKWTANARERVRRSPTIADIDGDSNLEILVAGYSAHLYVFTIEGDLKEELPLKGATNAAPTIVDFKNDGQLAVVCATDADVSLFSWMQAKPGSKPTVLYSEYRGHSARTGTSRQVVTSQTAHIAAIDFGDLYVDKNEFCVKVKNPKKQKLALELKIVKNNSAPLFQTVDFQDTDFIFKLPYTLTGQSAVDIRFAATLKQNKKIIAAQEKSFYVIPYAKDSADLKATLANIRSKLPDLKETVSVENQLLLLQSRFSELKEKMNIAGTLSALQRSELRANVSSLRKEVFTLSKMVEAAVDAGSPLAIYSANPWAPFGGTDEIAEGRLGTADATVHAFSGEIESAAFNLANYSDAPLFVRIEPGVLISEKDSSSVLAQNVFELHELIDVPTQSLDMSGDALPLLGQAQTMIIPQWSLRQLWINVKTSELSPGAWNSSIRIRSLEVEPKEAEARLAIHVSKAALPETQALNLCHWGYVHTSVLKDMPQAAIDDQVAHGTNVFVATNTFVPKAEFDADGNIVGDLDFSALDEYVLKHSPFGTILFFNYQSKLKGPAKHFTPLWEKAHAAWLQRWFEHMKSLGIDYSKYALYPIDEPGLREGLVDDHISYAKVIRQVDENVQIYTDPVAGATMADLKKMADYVDIWCPNRGGYLLDIGLDKLAFIKSTGQTVWTYECAGNAKHQSPLGYYRAQSWMAWRYGLTGIGFWSYCTARHDPWYTPVGGNDYLLIYQGDGVVTSKRWEAVRDGIEDYSMILSLKQALKNASPDVDQATLLAAKELLEKDAFDIAAYCGLDEYGTQPQTGGMSVLRKVEDIRWAKIRETREKLAMLLEDLNQ